MPNHPTLFSRTSTGAIQVWSMETDGAGRYRSTSGQRDGVKTTSEWTVAKPKNVGKANATTAADQAEAEVKAKYTKQLKEGYHESMDDVDQALYFSPQLAHKWEDYKDELDWSKGVYVSPKMDGVRSLLSAKGAASRNGRPFVSFPHILRELGPLFAAFPGFVVDGEVYSPRLSSNFERIISLAKKSKPTAEDLAQSEEHLQYWIFDFPSLPGGFHERWSAGTKLYEKFLGGNKWVKLCDHKLISSAREIETHMQAYLQEGFEGLMVNTYNGPYLQKRSRELLKYKIFQEAEFKILSISEGTGNRSGMFGYATLQIGDSTFDSNARGSEEFYKRLLKDKDSVVGAMGTVRYQNLTSDGKPRFPVLVAIRDYE